MNFSQKKKTKGGILLAVEVYCPEDLQSGNGENLTIDATGRNGQSLNLSQSINPAYCVVDNRALYFARLTVVVHIFITCLSPWITASSPTTS